MPNGSSSSNEGNSSLTYDRTRGSFSNPANSMDVAIQQEHYNTSKVALDDAINVASSILDSLVSENSNRPVYYPADSHNSDDLLLNSSRAHLALVRHNSSAKGIGKLPIPLDDSAPSFRVLKLSVGTSRDGAGFVADLDKASIASLLEKKLLSQAKYLRSLKQRLDDTSSKVLVTGDLNAGKSTFCNALLRRKVLPEDQQPCTLVFCEVIDAGKDNMGREEVHAIAIGQEYDRNDESTYKVFALDRLEDLVYECEEYSLLKVYVLDTRLYRESLLCNGVIDIQLIDAPGLNMDSYQTTQVFSRQEEIDLVVFVVNSENHFTLLAKEFIAAAAKEKQYVFIVLNRFDKIKNTERCKSKILDQVKTLSPDTYKNAPDFVHFVSSTNAFSGDDDDESDNGDGDDDPEEPDIDFDRLEASLRRFLLEKRGLSKLLPAKTYLQNLYTDLASLSGANERMYALDREAKRLELLQNVGPQYNQLASQSLRIADAITNMVERTGADIYSNTRMHIQECVATLGDKQVAPYRGIQFLLEYARDTRLAMERKILHTVRETEQDARKITESTVEEIMDVGKNALGPDFTDDQVFQADLMFSRKQDSLSRSLDDSFAYTDFFDPSWDSALVWLGVPLQYVAVAKTQLDKFNPVSMLASVPASALELKQLVPTQLTLHTLYSSGKILTAGAVAKRIYDTTTYISPAVLTKVAAPILVVVAGAAAYYLVCDMPNAFSRKQARRFRRKIDQSEYVHRNATRMAQESARVLSHPTRKVMANFQTTIDKRTKEKERLEQCIADANKGISFFHDLLEKVLFQQESLTQINLDSLHTVD